MQKKQDKYTMNPEINLLQQYLDVQFFLKKDQPKFLVKRKLAQNN